MGKQVVHKFFRKLKTGDQFILCSGKKCNNVESGISYFWSKVKCKRCRKLKGARRS